jgi:site-specific DNA-cytosine methylase
MLYNAIMLSNIYGGFKETKPRVHVGKSVTIRTASGGGHIPSLIINNIEKEFSLEDFKRFIRKVTPLECERLQTLPDNYTKMVSDTQRYKCIGNGWTVDVIAHILQNIK